MTTNGKRRVGLVGHCGPDSHALAAAIRGFAPEVEVERFNDSTSLERALPELDVLLINRVIDGRFPTERGVDLVRELRGRRHAKPMLLISDLPEAQAAAQEAGAMPGFGKSEMRDDKARARLLAALDAAEEEQEAA